MVKAHHGADPSAMEAQVETYQGLGFRAWFSVRFWGRVEAVAFGF